MKKFFKIFILFTCIILVVCLGIYAIQEYIKNNNSDENNEEEEIEILKQDVMRKYDKAQKQFDDAPEESQQFLKLFSFICLLSFDVYTKRLLIEKLIDEIRDHDNKDDRKTKKSKD